MMAEDGVVVVLSAFVCVVVLDLVVLDLMLRVVDLQDDDDDDDDDNCIGNKKKKKNNNSNSNPGEIIVTAKSLCVGESIQKKEQQQHNNNYYCCWEDVDLFTAKKPLVLPISSPDKTEATVDLEDDHDHDHDDLDLDFTEEDPLPPSLSLPPPRRMISFPLIGTATTTTTTSSSSSDNGKGRRLVVKSFATGQWNDDKHQHQHQHSYCSMEESNSDDNDKTMLEESNDKFSHSLQKQQQQQQSVDREDLLETLAEEGELSSSSSSSSSSAEEEKEDHGNCIVTRETPQVSQNNNNNNNAPTMVAVVVAIQRIYRGHVLQQKFQIQRISAIRIQAHVRTRLSNHHPWNYHQMTKEEACGRRIQQWYRRRQCYPVSAAAAAKKRQQSSSSSSSITIQRMYRGHAQTKSVRQTRRLATKLQALVRRRYHHHRYLGTKEACRTIQRSYRQYHHSLKQQQQQQRSLLAIITIQNVYRGHRIRVVQQHQQRQRLVAATLILQAWYRRHRANQAAAATATATTAKHEYCRQIRASQVIQRTFRNYKSRSAAAMVLQRSYRAFHQQRQQVAAAAAAAAAAIQIQSHIRRKQASRHFLQAQIAWVVAHGAATVIQAFVRGCSIRRRCAIRRRQRQEQEQSATTIQTKARGYLCRVHGGRQEKAVIKLQSQYRRMYHSKGYKNVLQTRRQAAAAAAAAAVLRIQNFYRNQIMQRRRQEQEESRKRAAARIIQRSYRNHHINVATLSKTEAAASNKPNPNSTPSSLVRTLIGYQIAMSVVQSGMAGNRLGTFTKEIKTVHQGHSKRNDAVIFLQKNARGYLCRLHRKRQEMVATKIQSHYRMKCASKKYLQRRNTLLLLSTEEPSIIIIQRAFRKSVVKPKTDTNTNDLQSFFRALNRYQTEMSEIQRKDYVVAAVTIERVYRGHQARKNLQAQTLLSKNATQTSAAYPNPSDMYRACRNHWRELIEKESEKKHRAANAIQIAYRLFQSKKQHSAAKAIQQAYRSHLCLRRRKRGEKRVTHKIFPLKE